MSFPCQSGSRTPARARLANWTCWVSSSVHQFIRVHLQRPAPSPSPHASALYCVSSRTTRRPNHPGVLLIVSMLSPPFYLFYPNAEWKYPSRCQTQTHLLKNQNTTHTPFSHSFTSLTTIPQPVVVLETCNSVLHFFFLILQSRRLVY